MEKVEIIGGVFSTSVVSTDAIEILDENEDKVNASFKEVSKLSKNAAAETNDKDVEKVEKVKIIGGVFSTYVASTDAIKILDEDEDKVNKETFNSERENYFEGDGESDGGSDKFRDKIRDKGGGGGRDRADMNRLQM